MVKDVYLQFVVEVSLFCQVCLTAFNVTGKYLSSLPRFIPDVLVFWSPSCVVMYKKKTKYNIYRVDHFNMLNKCIKL